MTVKLPSNQRRGGLFGQGKVLLAKNIGKKFIRGQGIVPETVDPALSRQQRRLAARRGKR